jgi:hypothetical protein
MNIEETKEAIRVMQAFVDGKDIEILGPVKKWEPVNCPRWGWGDTQYRIKPTAKLRPWTADEVPLGAWMRMSDDPKQRFLISRTDDYIADRENWIQHAQHSTDSGKTWLPCGVMEEAK